MTAVTLGVAYAHARRIDDAARFLLDATVDHTTGQPVLPMADRGTAYLLAGRDAEAMAVAEDALRLARERGARGHEAHALRLLGDVIVRRETIRLADAENHYREALRLAVELGMQPLVAHCHLGLGELYERLDKRQDAQEHLGNAVTLYRDMGMRSWWEKAERRR